MVGNTISHYKILEKLGEGGMGMVYRAVDTKLDREVAIKFLSNHLSSDAEAVKRFTHEAKAASAVDHSHIGTIYEIAETDNGVTFSVMALYDGEMKYLDAVMGALFEYLRERDVLDSTISGNDSISHGGGAINANGGYMSIVGSTVSAVPGLARAACSGCCWPRHRC